MHIPNEVYIGCTERFAFRPVESPVVCLAGLAGLRELLRLAMLLKRGEDSTQHCKGPIACFWGYLSFPFFPGILLSRKPPETGWILKRAMVEKNGEATRGVLVCNPLVFPHLNGVSKQVMGLADCIDRTFGVGTPPLFRASFPNALGVDSLSILFNHRSSQKPIAVSPGMLAVF